MLRNHLEMHGFSTKQADEDADRLIVTTAIDLSQEKPVAIVGEDVDFILITQLSVTNSNVYFLKPSKGKTFENFYNSRSFRHQSIKNLICFIHSFTGCNTTSAIFM